MVNLSPTPKASQGRRRHGNQPIWPPSTRSVRIRMHRSHAYLAGPGHAGAAASHGRLQSSVEPVVANSIIGGSENLLRLQQNDDGHGQAWELGGAAQVAVIIVVANFNAVCSKTKLWLQQNGVIVIAGSQLRQ